MSEAESKLRVLSNIKKNILEAQKDREKLMIDFLDIKRKLMAKNQEIGKLQRKMLETIP